MNDGSRRLTTIIFKGGIKMNNTKLVIPSCNDFMAIYGCDCE